MALSDGDEGWEAVDLTDPAATKKRIRELTDMLRGDSEAFSDDEYQALWREREDLEARTGYTVRPRRRPETEGSEVPALVRDSNADTVSFGVDRAARRLCDLRAEVLAIPKGTPLSRDFVIHIIESCQRALQSATTDDRASVRSETAGQRE